MLAKEIMRKRVVTASPEMTVRELAKIFVEKGISGAPVVDAALRLVGVVSQTDIVRCGSAPRPDVAVPTFYSEDEKAYQSTFQIETPDFTRVSEVMTPMVIAFDENSPVELIAKKMVDRHIHRVIVTRGKKIAGIITSMDMLRALIKMQGQLVEAGEA